MKRLTLRAWARRLGLSAATAALCGVASAAVVQIPTAPGLSGAPAASTLALPVPLAASAVPPPGVARASSEASLPMPVAGGVIGSVDVSRSQVTIYGRAVTVHPAARMFNAQGRPVIGGVAGLRSGDEIRYGLSHERAAPASGPTFAASAMAPQPVGSASKIVLVYLLNR